MTHCDFNGKLRLLVSFQIGRNAKTLLRILKPCDELVHQMLLLLPELVHQILLLLL